MALDEDFAGGYSQYYSPETGMMLVDPNQHQMFAQMMAQKGAPVPPDFPDDFTHMDAHGIMQNATKDQSRAPGVGTGLPQQGSFDERFSDAYRGPPGMPFTAPSRAGGFGQPPGATDTLNPKFPAPQGAGDEPSLASRPLSPGPKAVYDVPGSMDTLEEARARRGPSYGSRSANPDEQGPPQHGVIPPSASERPRFGQFINPARPGAGFPSSVPGPRPIAADTAKAGEAPPLSPDVPSPRPRPTSAPESPTATGATTPEGDTSDKPGGLNKEDPSAKTVSSQEKKGNKENAWDSFGKALAGVSAMKPPTPVFPHPGNIPHPGTQLSRSTVPSELLKELSSIGRPGTLLRLGAALKGR